MLSRTIIELLAQGGGSVIQIDKKYGNGMFVITLDTLENVQRKFRKVLMHVLGNYDYKYIVLILRTFRRWPMCHSPF